MTSSISSPIASQSTGMIWKDIWWIQGVAFIITFLTLHLSFKALIRFLGCFKENNERECVLNDLSWSVIDDLSNENPTIIDSQKDQCKVNDGESNKLPDNNRLEANRRELDDFYDLSHHGILFYNDKLSMSSRQRIPRMHSTVTEATLVSMMRHRKFPGGPTPPAFPKFQDLVNAYDHDQEDSLKTQFCSGDARVPENMKPTFGRLTTVVEEDNSDGVMSCDRLSCKSEPSGRKKLDYSNALKMANKRFTIAPPKTTFVAMKSVTPEIVIGKKDTTTNENNCPKPTECEFQFPPDYDTTEEILCTTTQLECLICKNKIQCVCDNCSSLATLGTALQQGKNKEVYQDFSEVQDEFIDENFEDMESIISNVLTESSNLL